MIRISFITTILCMTTIIASGQPLKVHIQRELADGSKKYSFDNGKTWVTFGNGSSSTEKLKAPDINHLSLTSQHSATIWEKKYDGVNSGDSSCFRPFSFVKTSANEICILTNGNWLDQAFFSISSTGDLLWKKRHGTIESLLNMREIRELPDKSIQAYGYRLDGHFLSSSGYLYNLILSPTGNIINSQYNYSENSHIRELGSLLKYNEDCFISYGDDTVNSKRYFLYLVKTDSIGQKYWTKKYDLGENYTLGANQLIFDKDGSIVVSVAKTYFDKDSIRHDEIVIVKLTQEGQILWSKNIGSTYEAFPRALILLRDSGLLVSGTTYNHSTDTYHTYISKLNSEGKLIWEKEYIYGANSAPNSSIELHNGDIVIGGYSDDNNGNGSASHDMWLLKIDRNGNILSSESWGTPSGDVITHVLTDVDENIIALGYSGSLDEVYYGGKLYVAKIQNTSSSVVNTNFSSTSEVQLFPNPSSTGYIIIGTLNTEDVSVCYEIFSVLGQQVLSGKSNFNNQRLNINTSSLLKGSYMIKLELDQKVLYRSFIID